MRPIKPLEELVSERQENLLDSIKLKERDIKRLRERYDSVYAELKKPYDLNLMLRESGFDSWISTSESGVYLETTQDKLTALRRLVGPLHKSSLCVRDAAKNTINVYLRAKNNPELFVWYQRTLKETDKCQIQQVNDYRTEVVCKI